MKITFVNQQPKTEYVYPTELEIGQALRWDDTKTTIIRLADDVYLKLYGGDYMSSTFCRGVELARTYKGQLIDGEVNIEVSIR